MPSHLGLLRNANTYHSNKGVSHKVLQGEASILNITKTIKKARREAESEENPVFSSGLKEDAYLQNTLLEKPTQVNPI